VKSVHGGEHALEVGTNGTKSLEGVSGTFETIPGRACRMDVWLQGSGTVMLCVLRGGIWVYGNAVDATSTWQRSSIHFLSLDSAAAFSVLTAKAEPQKVTDRKLLSGAGRKIPRTGRGEKGSGVVLRGVRAFGRQMQAKSGVARHNPPVPFGLQAQRAIDGSSMVPFGGHSQEPHERQTGPSGQHLLTHSTSNMIGHR